MSSPLGFVFSHQPHAIPGHIITIIEENHICAKARLQIRRPPSCQFHPGHQRRLSINVQALGNFRWRNLFRDQLSRCLFVHSCLASLVKNLLSKIASDLLRASKTEFNKGTNMNYDLGNKPFRAEKDTVRAFRQINYGKGKRSN